MKLSCTVLDTLQTWIDKYEDICNVIFLGYQDLTNKLLRNINEKLAEELALVSDKLGRLEKVMGISEDEEESEVEGEEEVCLLTQLGPFLRMIELTGLKALQWA